MRSLFAVVTFFAAVAYGQLANLPECAIINAVAGSTCRPSDPACYCSDGGLINTVQNDLATCDENAQRAALAFAENLCPQLGATYASAPPSYPSEILPSPTIASSIDVSTPSTVVWTSVSDVITTTDDAAQPTSTESGASIIVDTKVLPSMAGTDVETMHPTGHSATPIPYEGGAGPAIDFVPMKFAWFVAAIVGMGVVFAEF